MKKPENTNCVNCQTPLQGSICHQCGQKQLAGRWETKDLLRQFIEHFSNIEKGFLFTAKSLFLRPGILIKDYWKGKTVNSYNPFRYMLIWTTVNLLINFWLGIDDLIQADLQPQIVEDEFGTKAVTAADQKFDTWLNALVLLMLPIFTWLTSKLFKKSEKNYAEHLILNSFLLGQHSLISSFTQFVFYLIPSLFPFYFTFNFLIGLIYNTYVFKHLFGQKWGRTFAKALVFGLIGTLIFILIIVFASWVALSVS